MPYHYCPVSSLPRCNRSRRDEFQLEHCFVNKLALTSAITYVMESNMHTAAGNLYLQAANVVHGHEQLHYNPEDSLFYLSVSSYTNKATAWHPDAITQGITGIVRASIIGATAVGEFEIPRELLITRETPLPLASQTTVVLNANRVTSLYGKPSVTVPFERWMQPMDVWQADTIISQCPYTLHFYFEETTNSGRKYWEVRKAAVSNTLQRRWGKAPVTDAKSFGDSVYYSAGRAGQELYKLVRSKLIKGYMPVTAGAQPIVQLPPGVLPTALDKLLAAMPPQGRRLIREGV